MVVRWLPSCDFSFDPSEFRLADLEHDEGEGEGGIQHLDLIHDGVVFPGGEDVVVLQISDHGSFEPYFPDEFIDLRTVSTIREILEMLFIRSIPLDSDD